MNTQYLTLTASMRRKNIRRSRLAAIALLATVCTALLSLPTSSQAQTDDAAANSTTDLATVTAIASTSQVQVAEPFTVELRVTAAVGTRILLPAIGPQLGSFDVVDQQDVLDIPSDNSPGERIWTRLLTLESIVTGDLQIPAMEIQAVKGSDSRIVRSETILIRVLSVLEDRADPTQFRDIQSVVDVEVPRQTSYDWVLWAAGGLGLLTIASAAIAIVVRRRTWLTPNQWALQELDSLQDSKAIQDRDSEQVSLVLSSILRNYLELQFAMSAPAQTTEELLQQIKSERLLDAEIAARFGKVFETADLTKFAGWQLSTIELSDAVNEARKLVIQTAREIESQSTTPAETSVPTEAN